MTTDTNISFSGNEYEMLMNSLHVSVSKHLLDKHFTVISANDYYYELIGYPKEEYIAIFHNQCDLYFQENKADWDKIVKKVTEGLNNHQSGYTCITRMKNKSGTMMWIRIVGTFTEEIINNCQVVYTVMTDVTDLVQTRLEQTVTYNNIPGFMAKFRAGKDKLEFIGANEKFIQYFEGSTVNDTGYFLTNVETAENRTALTENYPAIRGGEPVQFILEARNRGGERSWFQLNGECIDWVNNDPVYLFIYIDMTEVIRQRELQRISNEQLTRLAFVDPVTEGDNRNCFEMKATKTIHTLPPNSFVLVSLDIQKFKLLNDLFGVENGDYILRHVYNVIKKHLYEDEYVARISADNFSILMKADRKDSLEKRLTDIAEDVNDFNRASERKHMLFLIAGIYFIDDTELSVLQLQDRANSARKNIKDKAENRLCTCSFFSEMDWLKLMKEKSMEDRMQTALREGEFIVYLQPKLSLAENVIAGAEALVRWQNPEVGLIPPDEFIPFFEKNRFIISLDLYVFEKVCVLLRKWLDAGIKPIPISVNMSRAHITSHDFLKPYIVLQGKYKIPPELIEIELTETIVFENPEILSDVINQIHQQGFRCSLDDFGSGYSSLNILKEIYVDTLKMDKAFLHSEHADDKRERDVITSVIDLAQKLEMTTVAEGVETEAQAKFLRKSSCDMLQGYVFSRPIPPEEFEKLAYGDIKTAADTGQTAAPEPEKKRSSLST